MHKLKIAICDDCEDYRQRFVAYLVAHKAQDMEVEAFSVPEIFGEALEHQKFDAVILGRGFEELVSVVSARQQPCVWLKDTMPNLVAEEDCCNMEEWVSEIFRYQSVEKVLHEVQVLAGRNRGETIKTVYPGTRLEVIGICSPVRHEMQFPFSIVFSAELAKRKKVLYVNLMEHSGFLEIFELAGGFDMGDIVLRLRNHRLISESFLRSVYEMEGVFYIPPFSNPKDLHGLTLSDYLSFLEFLEEHTDFEAIVIDFGEGLMEFAEMLERCTTIYSLIRSGYFYECQTRCYIEYLKSVLGDEFTARMRFKDVPFSAKHIRGGSGVLKQLLWSEFGDYVRSCLAGEFYADK